MSETNSTSEPTRAAPGPESQQQRWLKYGANVVVTSLLVVALACVVVWAAQGTRKATSGLRGRADLTSDASQSLKPQTVSLIKDLQTPVKLVSLYPKLKKEEAAERGDTYQRVLDVLDEYRRKGRNIEIDAIDPVADPGKLNTWLVDVKKRYGSNIGAYEDLLKGFPTTLEEIKKLASQEVEKMRALPDVEFKDERQVATLNAAFNTVRGFPAFLDLINEGIKEELNPDNKLPDYKGQVQNVEGSLSTFGRQSEAVRKALEQLRDAETAPQAARDYAKDAAPRFEALKKQADDVLAKIKGLGELKLDDVRKKLIPRDETEPPPPAIAVMGKDDIRVIDDQALWKSGQSTGLTGAADERVKLRFAGEQQITSAILGLQSATKPKVAFIRAGGPPRTTGGMMAEPVFSEVAERLKAYNFDVIEKDISGSWAMQAMQRGAPPTPEPSDEELKGATWVVLAEPAQQQMGMMMPPGNQLGVKLKDHLDAGGSAICLMNINGEDLSTALKEWGVEVNTNVLAVHEQIEVKDAAPEDFIEMARRIPPIFIVNQFGDHPIAKSVNSLDAALVPLVPVKAVGAPDCTVTPIIPLPSEPKSWGETDLSVMDSLFGRRSAPPKLDPAVDVPGPIYGGAVVERKGKGRLVVIGCQNMITSQIMNMSDPKMAKAKVQVARFPGNGELFTNSIFWLTNNEKMIALSPAAMDTARIAPIGSGALSFWRVGVFLIGLPALALVAGFMVWQTRRA